MRNGTVRGQGVIFQKEDENKYDLQAIKVPTEDLLQIGCASGTMWGGVYDLSLRATGYAGQGGGYTQMEGTNGRESYHREALVSMPSCQVNLYE